MLLFVGHELLANVPAKLLQGSGIGTEYEGALSFFQLVPDLL